MYKIIKRGEQYGLCGEGIEIYDIFTSYKEINLFVYMLNRFQASPEHIYDIIEDYFGRFGFINMPIE